MKKKFLKILLIISSLLVILGIGSFVFIKYKQKQQSNFESNVSKITLSIKYQFDDDYNPKSVRIIGVIDGFEESEFGLENIEYCYFKITDLDSRNTSTFSINTLYDSISGVGSAEELGGDYIVVLPIYNIPSSLYQVDFYLKIHESDYINHAVRSFELPNVEVN